MAPMPHMRVITYVGGIVTPNFSKLVCGYYQPTRMHIIGIGKGANDER